MISHLSGLVSGVVAIGLLEATGAAGATSASDEEALIHHGIELRKAQDDLAARGEFQKAYDLTHSPRAAAQLGLAEFALGRWDDADGHISEALRASKDPWITKYHAELDRSLKTIKAHVARIEVIGEPAGADIYVNGRLVGQVPLATPISVSEGQADVELRARGFARASRTVTVSGGQYQRLVIRLEREASANGTVGPAASAPGAAGARGAETSLPRAGSAMATPGGTGSAAADRGATPASTGSGDTDSVRGASPTARAGDTGRESNPWSAQSGAAGAGSGPSTGRLVAKWTSLGLAGAALAVGVGATVIHQNNLSTFGSLHGGGCFDNGGQAVDVDGNPVPECQPSLDAYRSARVWQIVGFAGAGVFAVTWLVLALTEPAPAGAGKRAADRPVAAWVCAPTMSAAGATCAVRF